MQVIEKDHRTINVELEEFATHNAGAHTLKLSLLVLETIDNTNRLNLFLKNFDRNPIDTGVFYRLLASILEKDKNLSEDDQKQYFDVVKQLYNLSDPFYYVNGSICFAPDYDLDMFVLDIPCSRENSDEYATLNYQFTTNAITYTELLEKAKELTNNQRQSPK